MYFTQPLHRALQQHPDKVALAYGERHTTFRTLQDRVARLAGALQSLGMKAGDRVAMLALNSDRYWEYLVAVPWGGGVINPCNTRWSAKEIASSINDSGARFILIDDNFTAIAEELRTNSPLLQFIIYVGSETVPHNMLDYEALIAQAKPVADAVRRGNDLFGLFYTGGTTGAAKGVMLSHNSFMSSSLSIVTESVVSRPGVFLHAAPMFHLADLGISAAHWIVGNTHCFIPAFSPEAILKAVASENVTETVLVPTMIQILVDHPVMQRSSDLMSLRHVVYGGSSIAGALIDRALVALPDTRFVQMYGMTELSPLGTALPAFYHTAEGRKHNKLSSAGRPGHCVEIRVADPAGNPIPLGEKGEILVRGPNVMLGYWNKPKETAEVLKAGWMHTGDAGYVDNEGFVYIVDRIKDMIVSGGENVYSAEVENALSHHPAVQACAVIGIPNERWGESVHAFVVLQPDASTTDEDLSAHCRELIAGYKCPRSFEYLSELPLSGPGKVLKAQLRERYWGNRERQVS